MPSRRTSARVWRLILSPVALLAVAAAAGQDEAPRRPPKPFAVFVYAIEPADAALTTRLEEALSMVRKRIERRRRWFRLADSRETSDITLRIVHYRRGHPKDPLVRGGRTEAMHDCWATGYHYVDAVALAGDVRAALSGMDHRCVDERPSLRSAASHLAEELERFAKDNYGPVSRARAQAIAKRERGDTPR